MNLRFRFLLLLLSSLWRKRIGLVDESVLKMRALPTDLDFSRVNNGRFCSFMDLGRLDIIFRTGLFWPSVRRKWTPLVGSEIVQFKSSLRLWQPFTLHTRILCWDRKWFFFEQTFISNGRTVAVGLVKGLLRGPGGNVATADVASIVNYQQPSPPMPPTIRRFVGVETLDGEPDVLERSYASDRKETS